MALGIIRLQENYYYWTLKPAKPHKVSISQKQNMQLQFKITRLNNMQPKTTFSSTKQK